METKTVILWISLIFGGWLSNKLNVAIFGWLLKQEFDSIKERFGQRGLNFKVAIGLMVMNIPGLLIGKDTNLNIVCTSSSIFALILLLRNLPKKDSETKKA